ncbi:ABC transporter ATP-binding protein [Flavisolibacter ginsenosidimutans]|uniref:ABC transporter ATP-binding protein n=1 Tax=Flavisolibacter ginsenosidimutans TaxID=661481 RepID=A0A5B8UHH1_9BACT|nr:ABC transporter ATP-binding protein [Flavisolibacter ginsenosidimutans]QEC55795.1 ABC transporter ATP-binding protein [Flavisolibacter ginsenosidimutans]
MQQTVLEARHIYKSFKDQNTPVLSDVSFTVNKGEFVSIVGKSGCGKSTLLYVLSTMDTDYEGELLIDGELLTGKKASRLAQIRNEKIGFVFQFHYLLNEFSVLKNIMLPAMKLNRLTEKEIEENATKWLADLGLEKAAQKFPNQLSGGEKQRVAIARALINDPHIIMGDEPTGNLDKKNSGIVFDIFKNLATQYNQTLLIVTHDPEFAAGTQRKIEMEDGKIISQGR